MSATRCCEECGTALPPRAPAGLCPKCLLGQAVMAPAESAVGGRPAATRPEAAPAGSSVRRLGDYELLEKIASGGMGVVYKARQLSLNRIVALKMIPPGRLASEESVLRFQAEAEAAASLQHPHIVAIHETGQWGDQHYFSMDYVAGENLADAVRSQPLSPVRAAQVLKAIAEAVHYAHQKGILHRDLKPSNIILDEVGAPHVTDFGLAKRLGGESALTLTGQVIGSPGFMPPEQAGGPQSAADVRSDVYGLGAVLYYVLAGRPPFQADTLTTLLKQVLETEPVPPRLLNPSIPHDLENICLKCLEKEPPRRYATAQDLAEDLGRFLNGQPVQARPVGPAGKTWRWCRRKPALATAISAVVLVGAVGFVGILTQWQRAATSELLARQNAYAADIKLVEHALADNDVGLALSYLDKHRPGGKAESRKQKAEMGLRGWEWRYLWQQCQPDMSYSLCRDSARIGAVSVAQDGRRLAVQTDDDKVTLWDLTAKRPMSELSVPGWIRAMALSPNGRVLVVSRSPEDQPAAVEFWDLQARQLIGSVTPPSPVRSLALSPDGRLLATLNDQGTAEVSEWESGRSITNLTAPPLRRGGTGVVVFSPDGNRLAVGVDYGGLRVVNLRNLAVLPIETQTTDGVSALAFSPDSQLLAACFAYAGEAVCLWDSESGTPRGQLTNATPYVRALAFTPDGQRLAAASMDGTIRVWNVAQPVPACRLRGHPTEGQALAFQGDGRTLISACSQGAACVWDLTATNRTAIHATLQISISATPSEMAPGAFARGAVHPKAVTRVGLALAPDSRSFITTDPDGTLGVWDTRAMRKTKSLPELGSNCWYVARSPDGHWLAVGDASGKVHIWDRQVRRQVTSLEIPFEWCGSLRFSRSGRFLLGKTVFNNEATALRLWRTDRWEEVPLAETQEAGLRSIDLSPDDRRLALGYANGSVKVLSFPSGALEVTFASHQAVVWRVVFSPDGRRLAAACGDGQVRLWDVSTRRELASFRGHSGMVWDAAFSPDGRRLATTGADAKNAVRLWDLATHRELLTLPAEGEFFVVLAFSTDGNILMTTTLSGIANLWRAPSWEEIEAAERDPSAKEATPPGTVPPSGLVHPEALASTQWLEEHLRDPAVRIVDARFGQSESGFTSGHIPGAVRVSPFTELRDTTKTDVHVAPAPLQFEALMNRLGIARTNTVVVYDAEGGLWCARLWWLLRYYGHPDAKLLHGGLGKWRRENRPLEDTVSQPVRSAFRAQAHPELRATFDQVRDAVGKTNIIILDALPGDQFSGKQPMMPGLPAGHIPSAKNVPAPSNLASNGELLAPERLAAMYGQAGMTRSVPVITYCGGGYYGAFTFYVLYQLGYENVRLYDGSWVEWISKGGAIETAP